MTDEAELALDFMKQTLQRSYMAVREGPYATEVMEELAREGWIATSTVPSNIYRPTEKLWAVRPMLTKMVADIEDTGETIDVDELDDYLFGRKCRQANDFESGLRITIRIEEYQGP